MPTPGRARGAISRRELRERATRVAVPDQRGLTLLEMILAVAIFAVVSVLAFGGLNQILRIDEATASAQRELAALDVAFALIGRDLAQIVPVAPRDQFGDRQPEFWLRQTREGFEARWVRTGGGPDGLEFIGWRLDGEGLARLRYAVVDGADLDRPQTRRLLRFHEGTAATDGRAIPEGAALWVVTRDGERARDWRDQAWPAQLVLTWPSERWGVIERRFAFPERVSPAAVDADAIAPDAEAEPVPVPDPAAVGEGRPVGDDALAPGEGGGE